MSTLRGTAQNDIINEHTESRLRNVHPLLSVIVTIYNVEQYLEKCIDSIINQTYQNLEIILVDDGSEDKSSRICNNYAKRDGRIKVIHKTNGGVVSARKAGIQIVSGDYATYVDGDDRIEVNMYEVLMNQIKDADIIICGEKRDYGKNSIALSNKIEKGVYEGEELKEKIYKRMIYTGCFYEMGIQGHVYNKVFRTEILKCNQMQVDDRIRVGEDPACFYPTLLDARKIVVIPECFYHYQMRENSIMGVNDKEELKRYKILYSYLKKRFLESNDLKESLLCQLDFFMLYVLMLKEIEVLQDEANTLFPYGRIGKEDRIVVYGAGRFGCELVRYLRSQNEYSLVLWVDKNSRGEIKDINEIKEIGFDYILVAVLLKDISDEIVNNLVQMDIPKKKIKLIDMGQIEKKKDKIRDFFQ